MLNFLFYSTGNRRQNIRPAMPSTTHVQPKPKKVIHSSMSSQQPCLIRLRLENLLDASSEHIRIHSYHLHRLIFWRVTSSCFVFFPIGQHVANSGAVRQFVNLFKVLLGDLKRLRGNIGDVLSDQLAGINAGLVDLLKEEAAERFDAGAQECAVEWNVNAFERDRGETALEINGFGFGLCFLGTLSNDFHQMRFDFFEGHLLRK